MKPNNLLYICFNRPDFVHETLNDLLSIDWDHVLIVSDGWRNEREKSVVIEVRELVKEIVDKFPGKVDIIYREYNYGCRRNIEHALEYFFNRYKQGWVFEDDIRLINKDEFKAFRDNWLEKGHLSLYNPLKVNNGKLIKTKIGHYFIWGWYLNVEKGLSFRDQFNFAKIIAIIKTRGLLKGLRFIYLLVRTYFNKIDTWDSLYTVWSISNNIDLNIVPISLIENLGFDERATHTFELPVLHESTLDGVKDEKAWEEKLKKMI